MRFVGMLRIKNEAAWIERVIRSLLPLCEHVFILDDHSTDATPEICSSFDRVTVFESPFEGLDEKRDKDFLLDHVKRAGADWVIHIDGDEELAPGAQRLIQKAVVCDPHLAIVRFRVVYAWNDYGTIRTDGIYQRFMRPSMFRLAGQNLPRLTFESTAFGGNLHCWNHPQGLRGSEMDADHIRLLHYGYLTPEIRARKFEFYNRVDPGNEYEDQYRHITQGDSGGAPAHAVLKHAGPLRLERI
jgi:glycosyltransferase involved in cell wall biosynthesis